MEREGFSLPNIEPEHIGPEKYLTDEERERRTERRERQGGLSQYIKRWWRGDAHAHSVESTRKGFGYAEGIYDLDEMATYYQELGLEFAVMTEHASKPASPEKQETDSPIAQSLIQEAERITKRNREHPDDLPLLSGVETSIMFDEKGQATLDVPAEVLEKFDLVVASRHGIAQEKELTAIETSLLYAAQHPDVDVIGHPDRFLMAEHDWDMLRANNPEAQSFHERMVALQKKKRESQLPEERATLEAELQEMYPIIRKAIGKEELTTQDERNESLVRWHSSHETIIQDYWSMWERVLTVMAQNKKAFEINLGAQPSKRLIAMAAQAGVPFFINYDAHDFRRYKRDYTPEHQKAYQAAERWATDTMTADDEKTLRRYKEERLSAGPGVRALLRLVRWIKELERLGLSPDRVVNS